MAGEIDVAELAIAYRRLVLWFGVQLVWTFPWIGLGQISQGSAFGVILALGLLAIMLATVSGLAYYGYRTATVLGSAVGWLWGFAMFFPCVNAMTLLLLSAKATRTCRANDIPVGIFGPELV